jgi:hypothetical protein
VEVNIDIGRGDIDSNQIVGDLLSSSTVSGIRTGGHLWNMQRVCSGERTSAATSEGQCGQAVSRRSCYCDARTPTVARRQQPAAGCS